MSGGSSSSLCFYGAVLALILVLSHASVCSAQAGLWLDGGKSVRLFNRDMKINVVFREDPTIRAAGVGIVASLAFVGGGENNLVDGMPRVFLGLDDDGALVVSQAPASNGSGVDLSPSTLSTTTSVSSKLPVSSLLSSVMLLGVAVFLSGHHSTRLSTVLGVLLCITLIASLSAAQRGLPKLEINLEITYGPEHVFDDIWISLADGSISGTKLSAGSLRISACADSSSSSRINFDWVTVGRIARFCANGNVSVDQVAIVSYPSDLEIISMQQFASASILNPLEGGLRAFSEVGKVTALGFTCPTTTGSGFITAECPSNRSAYYSESKFLLSPANNSARISARRDAWISFKAPPIPPPVANYTVDDPDQYMPPSPVPAPVSVPKPSPVSVPRPSPVSVPRPSPVSAPRPAPVTPPKASPAPNRAPTSTPVSSSNPPVRPPVSAPVAAPTPQPFQAPPPLPLSSSFFASEIVQLPKPPSALDPNPGGSNCPHLEPGLRNWHDSSIWPGGVVPSPSSSWITIPSGMKVMISSNSLQTATYNFISVPVGSELIFNDQDISLSVRGIRVEGKLRIGSDLCRLVSRININFVGAKSSNDDLGQTTGTKGIAVYPSGTLDIHGYQYHPTWTRLASTVMAGSDTIRLQDRVNWEIGQRIVITTSAYVDEGSGHQNEVRTIAALIDSSTIRLDSPLSFSHFGGLEYQAEVGLLSRRISLVGNPADSDTSMFGGHVHIRGIGRISGTEFRKMGQFNILGRYPIHFHIMSDVASQVSYSRDNSIWNSFFRCVAIHASKNIRVLRNVAYDVIGHCYYLEDGVEENNVFMYNLGAFVKSIGGTHVRGGGQGGTTVYQSASAINPVDYASGPFYITNAYNTFVGNAASGGWAGYSFPNLRKPIGPSRTQSVCPECRPTLLFDGNSAHSNGWHWDFGSCFYVGGKLTEDSAGMLTYFTGRTGRITRLADGSKGPLRFRNIKASLCQMGFNHWGDRPEVVLFECHDCYQAGQFFHDAWVSKALINAKSNNPVSFNKVCRGFQFYDTVSKFLVTDTTFRNFRDDPNIAHPYNDRTALIGMTHSDVFKPGSIAATRNLRFESSDFSARVGIGAGSKGSSCYNIIDWDGSIAGSPGGQPHIIGSATYNWYNYNPSACRKVASNNWWYCPKGNHEICQLYIWIPNLTYEGYNTDNSATIVGSIKLWGRGLDASSWVPFTKQNAIAGVSNLGWYVTVNNGAPKTWTLGAALMPKGQSIYFATRYPSGTTFTINGYGGSGGLSSPTPFSRVNTISEVWNGDGFKYFFDGTHLYIKFLNHRNDGSAFERDGARVVYPDGEIGYTSRFWRVIIQASCSSSTSYCPVSDIYPPSSSWWN